jgi:hypothetical protein
LPDVRRFRNLKAILATASEPCLFLLHHHVCDLASDRHRALLRALRNLLMIVSDSRRFVRRIQDYAKRVGVEELIVHGHRHVLGNYDLGCLVRVHAHPSSTMGIEDRSVLDGVLRYTRIGFDGHFKLETVVLPR